MSRTYSEDRKRGFTAASPGRGQRADMAEAQALAAAAQGDVSAYFDLGVAYSTRSHAVACDLIEAHKWFNLAAVAGHACAKTCRADVAGELTQPQIAEAQRRAREWIAARAAPA